MIETGKICRRYLLQTVALLLIATVLVKGCEMIFHWQSLERPIVVSIVFSALVELADVVLWRMAVSRSTETLTTFYSAVSGFRMLLALAVLFVCYLFVGRDAMMPYVLVFLSYYIVFLSHHAVFFSRVSDQCDQFDNNKKCTN